MITYLDISRESAWDIIKGEVRDDEMGKRVSQHVADTERFIGIYFNDTPLGIFGGARASMLAEEGYIWFVDLPALCKHKIAFARKNFEILDSMFGSFTKMYGVTFSDRSKRWITWLGAKVEGDVFVFRRPHG